MNRLKEYWAQARALILNLLVRVEESQTYERLVLKFESLEPRRQRNVRNGTVFALLVVTALLFLSPLLSVWLNARDFSRRQTLLSDLQAFNGETSVVHRPAPRPNGFIALPISSADEVESSLTQVMAGFGVPADQYTLTTSPGGSLELTLTGISIRQLTSINFQLDGWHPALKVSNLHAEVSGERKDTLNATISIAYDGSAAGQFPAVAGASFPAPVVSSTGGDAPSAGADGNSFPPAPPSDFNPNMNGGDDAPVPAPPPDDFGGEMPPPPPFEEDI